MVFNAMTAGLLAQAEAGSEGNTQFQVLMVIAAVLAAIILPFVIGGYLSKAIRMPEYGWKIGVILCTLTCAGLVFAWNWDPETRTIAFKRGVDLKGGVILVYELAEDLSALPEDQDAQRASSTVNTGDLITALTNRLNPSGTNEIVVRPYGDRQVEIIIPEVDDLEVERIKRIIEMAGSLEFRIVANEKDHADVIAEAKQQAEDPDPARRKRPDIRAADGALIGKWVRVGREDTPGRLKPFKENVSGDIVRDARTGEVLEIDPGREFTEESLADYIEGRGIQEIDVLMYEDPYDVTGEDIGAVSRDVDNQLRPCVDFRMTGSGVDRFAALTGENSPSRGFYRRLGIVLDGSLVSAPRINSTIRGPGQITGRFTQDEVDSLVSVLRAGKLPAALQKTPISENEIDATLGADTIRKGTFAIGISLVAVILFIAVYYRFAGLVACLALMTNLVLILGLMLLLQAPLTLPGLAGLVLTVGMSVDANVLIFERIREETAKGSALRMAIRNGFSRAMTTIVDANLTTLITAVVLYAIGTDQIRGFAVTLILGILMSMYTAIFCSRVTFDIAERTRRLRRLNMMQFLGATRIDFIGKRQIAAIGSIALISVGLAGLVARGRDIFDIDFLGGTSVMMVLKEPVPADTVRQRLTKTFAEQEKTVVLSLSGVSVEGRPENTVFKVDTSIEDVDQLEKLIGESLVDDSGNTLLATYSMSVEDLRTEVPESGSKQTDTEQAETKEAETKESAPGADDIEKKEAEQNSEDGDASKEPRAPAGAAGSESSASNEAPDEDTATQCSEDAEKNESEQPPEKAAAADPTPAGSQPPAAEPGESPQTTPVSAPESQPAPESPPGPESEASEPQNGERLVSRARLKFGFRINGETLLASIVESAKKVPTVTLNEEDVRLEPVEASPDWNMESGARFDEWNVELDQSREDAEGILDQIKHDIASKPVWIASSKIGGKVAGKTRDWAVAALLASLLGIVGYIWFRFQHVTFGLAAVVALVHDVLITLGAIALSYWLAGALGFLLIEEFKISLPVMAALLTIIGYSLNDTIVVFDRIREVRGKSPEVTTDMLNISINQTLSRTLLTSLTTLIVVIILYMLGGQGIHGFAFSLVVGIVVGTYSSIFVASPLLLWMTTPRKEQKRKPVMTT